MGSLSELNKSLDVVQSIIEFHKERVLKVMKNVIYVVVDAYCYNNLLLSIKNKPITPFLNKLIDESISFTQMYTQAPYTEASLVTMLSGENCLDNGGYLFGNGNVKNPMFEEYQRHGYHTIYSYCPYVYSKGYLRGVDEFYYTRMYSIEPLLTYRINYYREKAQRRELAPSEIIFCQILLNAGFKDWKSQISDIILNADNCKMISQMQPPVSTIFKVKEEIDEEYSLFLREPKEYIKRLFIEWDSSHIREINKEYNKAPKYSLTERNKQKYQRWLCEYQKKINQINRRQGIDWSYLVPMLWRNQNGFEDFKHTCMNYYRHYTKQSITRYLDKLDTEYKTEVSMDIMFNTFFSSIKKKDVDNKPYFAYIHVQDFHLPSVFHTVDSCDSESVDIEFKEAFNILEQIDGEFKGNIVSVLSARFCDLKIEQFFINLKKQLNNDFLFVITADHGYPSYDNPPRPMVYNQTYTEAFHVPYIIYDSNCERKKTYDGLFSNMDGVDYLKCLALEKETCPKPRDYILCEYGGPGCPAIYEKPVCYTYIDKELRVSFECSLNECIDDRHVKSVFNLKQDPKEKKDLLKSHSDIRKAMKAVKKRHEYLAKQYKGDQFYDTILKTLDTKAYKNDDNLL